jgi:hypothetical protein
MIETIEAEFGDDEKAAISALDAGGLFKRLKRLANEEKNDQRHAPAIPGSAQPLDEKAVAEAVEEAGRLLAKYETFVTQ